MLAAGSRGTTMTPYQRKLKLKNGGIDQSLSTACSLLGRGLQVHRLPTGAEGRTQLEEVDNTCVH